MKRAISISIICALALGLTGCQSMFRRSDAKAPVSSSETGASRLPKAGIQVPSSQMDRAIAASARDLPPAGYIQAQDKPIYNNPKIAKVILAPHIDKNGRLYGSQEMYQVADEGGWNVEALEPGTSGYIPATNVETPANIGNPVAAPARRSPPIPNESKHLVDEIDPENVVITGLLSQSEQTQANNMAAEKGMMAAWDEQLGWLLIPKTQNR